jgi:hypothetical protein
MNIYNMNIYFKVVEVQIQALEYIPKLGRDTSHPKFMNTNLFRIVSALQRSQRKVFQARERRIW